MTSRKALIKAGTASFYTVVENAGYEGEKDIRTFASLIAADRWITKFYEPDEVESMHVMIRRDCGDEREWM